MNNLFARLQAARARRAYGPLHGTGRGASLVAVTRIAPGGRLSRILAVIFLQLLLVATGAAARPQVTVNGTTLYLYRANLHVHTDVSKAGLDHKGTLSPKETLLGAKLLGIEIVGFSDHDRSIEGENGEWAALASASAAGMVSLRGFEWTYEDLWDSDHINVFGTERKRDANLGVPVDQALSEFYAWLTGGEDGADLTPEYGERGDTPVGQFNHIWWGTHFQAFGMWYEKIDKVMCLAELSTTHPYGPLPVSHAEKSLEFYNLALSKGWHLAPTIGADNYICLHYPFDGGNTGVWAKGSTRKEVMDALRNRRVFATEEDSLELQFWAEVQGHSYFMGDIVKAPQAKVVLLTFRAKSSSVPLGHARVELVEVRKQGDHRVMPLTFGPPDTDSLLAQVQWKDVSGKCTRSPDSGTVCYYVTIVLPPATLGKLALSAPIWIEGRKWPFDPVLVIDRSGSIQSVAGLMQELEKDAKTFVDRLLQQARTVAVVNFSGTGQAYLDCPPSNSHPQVLEAIVNPSIRGGATALFDAVALALESAPSGGKSALIVFSDGCENSSVRSLDRVLRDAQIRGVPVLTVGYRGSDTPTRNEKVLRALAQSTGGFYENAENLNVEQMLSRFSSYLEYKEQSAPVGGAF